ncbi:MAG: prephenate dehydratase [Methylovulum miyakonense]|uniref:prephenate dehydratase n=1 Tax=Methylovulum miyakonense TaxID=645578 RepID=UPI003BB6EA59
MTAITPLAELRERIDSIDAEILRLLNQRATCAMEVAKTKIAQGEVGTFYRPDRESLVLRRIQDLNQGPLSNETVIRFFREIMSACLALEKPLEVAFLGPEGTFTQQAAFKHFGHAVKTVPAATINEIFNAVETRLCQFGVVPVENSTEGVISHTLDRLLVSPLKICGEVEIRVHQNLLGLAENLADISTVYSHQQSLAQCRQWLDKYLPNAQRVAVSSNAEAARLAASDKQFAAIAGIAAADVYQLPVIEKNIEDIANNTTRFIIIGQQTSTSTGKDKTSLVVSTGNKPGALHRTLEPFATFGVDMVNIESRPSHQGLWDYVFFIDIQGHADDPQVAGALAALQDQVNMLKILGSYPKAVF